jgi:hypothetical protein
MMNFKKTYRKLLIALGLLFSVAGFSQSIPAHFFGQNAWMPDTIGTAVYNGKLHKNWDNIKNSGAAIIRFGGIAPDKNMPTNFQYIKMIDSIRAKGMEPIMQVPFDNWKYNAQQAANIVTYVNKVMNRNIKYWVIGNEPDLGYQYNSASQVAAYFKPFASAMKAVDPSILTIGPECAWYNANIINGLTQPGGPDDITGKDGAGNYYLDIVSFHTYPFNGSQTRAQVISKLMESGGFNDNLATLNARITAANASHGRSGASALKIAVTEANINWQNSGSDNLNGLGVNSFIGAQFVSEMMGIAMKQGVDFITLWSVIEGNGTPLNIGYLDASTANKKPLYYHYQMMAQNFKGNYATSTSNIANVKTIACKNAQQTTVMIMNQDQSNNYSFTVRLSTGSITATSALKVNVDAGMNIQYSENIPAQSSVLLTFNSVGAVVKKIVYTLNQHAVSNLAPTTEGAGVATGVNEEPAADSPGITMKGFTVKAYPNPAVGKFNLEMDRSNPNEVKFNIELFDMMGRLVYEKTSDFQRRKALVETSGASIADGTYIVRVTEEGDKDNSRSEKIVILH